MSPAGPILVVEDDTAILRTVTEALRDEGYAVLSAEHGGEAIDLVQQQSVALILLDMRMPVVDGWTFAQLYRDRPGPHAPIVVLTAATDARARAQQIGAADYLPKPFELDDLLAAVERWVGQPSSPSEPS